MKTLAILALLLTASCAGVEEEAESLEMGIWASVPEPWKTVLRVPIEEGTDLCDLAGNLVEITLNPSNRTLTITCTGEQIVDEGFWEELRGEGTDGTYRERFDPLISNNGPWELWGEEGTVGDACQHCWDRGCVCQAYYPGGDTRSYSIDDAVRDDWLKHDPVNPDKYAPDTQFSCVCEIDRPREEGE